MYRKKRTSLNTSAKILRDKCVIPVDEGNIITGQELGFAGFLLHAFETSLNSLWEDKSWLPPFQLRKVSAPCLFQLPLKSLHGNGHSPNLSLLR
jgi:hypothetical protein